MLSLATVALPGGKATVFLYLQGSCLKTLSFLRWNLFETLVMTGDLLRIRTVAPLEE